MRIGIVANRLVDRELARWSALLALLTVVTAPAAAQDTHYWTNQYGTRAQLLNGVVVGSILDLSSTYYNPGSSALTEDRTLVLTTSAAELTTITVKNGAGQGKDLRSVRLVGAPSIFAVSLSSPESRHKWAISYLTHYDVDFKVDARRIDPAGAPGSKTYAEVNLSQRLTEPWGGVSWSYRANPQIGLGATMYGALRSQRGRFQNTAEAIASDSTGASLLGMNEYSYWNVRLLWKAGVFLDSRPLKAGLAITTPGLSLFGSGSSGINLFTLGVDTNGDGTPESAMAANYQDGLSTTIKSPLSIALGVSYALGPTSLFATVESFGGIPLYDVLEPQPFVAQSSGDTLLPRYSDAARAVTNWGIGIEHHLARRTTLYGGFITDRSAFVYDPEDLLESVSSWDIYHVALGGTFVVSMLEFTLGGNFSWGNGGVEQLGDVSQPVKQLADNPLVRGVRYRAFRFIFGITAGI